MVALPIWVVALALVIAAFAGFRPPWLSAPLFSGLLSVVGMMPFYLALAIIRDRKQQAGTSQKVRLRPWVRRWLGMKDPG